MNVLSEQIDQYLNIKSTQFNGVILIQRENKILFSKTQGYFDKKIKQLIDLEDKFFCGQITCQILACLILQNAEKNKLDLHEPISKYEIAIEWDWSKKITCHHLLTHQSGLTDKPKRDLEFIPGSNFLFSGYGYYLLGQILTKINNTTLRKQFRKLFKSIKLNQTDYYPGSNEDECVTSQFNYLTTGYIRIYGTDFWLKKENPYRASWPWPCFWPESGGIVTTAKDLHLWNLSLWEGKIINKNYLDTISTLYSYQNNHYGYEIGYGYGIQISDKEGLLEYSHEGYIWGYMSSNYYYPRFKTSLIILENVCQPLFKDKKRTFLTHLTIRNIIRSHLTSK